MLTVRSSLQVEGRVVLEYELAGTTSEDANAESDAAPRDVTRVEFERLPNGRFRLIIYGGGDVQLQRYVREQTTLERLRAATDL
jgi:hypothetical protein